jgi:hypothetical protein
MQGVGMKYDLTANIEVADGLTNGSSCEIKMFERRTKSPRPSIVWVKFDSKDIGKSTRKKYNHLYSKDVDRSWTPIFDIKRHEEPFVKPSATSMFASSTCIARFAVFDK